MANSHFRPNRKYKYGGNCIDELAILDFLFEFNAVYGLTATVWPLETTSGLGDTRSHVIRRQVTSSKTLTDTRYVAR